MKRFFLVLGIITCSLFLSGCFSLEKPTISNGILLDVTQLREASPEKMENILGKPYYVGEENTSQLKNQLKGSPPTREEKYFYNSVIVEVVRNDLQVEKITLRLPNNYTKLPSNQLRSLPRNVALSLYFMRFVDKEKLKVTFQNSDEVLEMLGIPGETSREIESSSPMYVRYILKNSPIYEMALMGDMGEKEVTYITIKYSKE